MSTGGCVNCTGTLKNTGIPAGDKPFGLVKGKAFMPLTASDNTRNFIDPLSPTLEADILAAVNNPDPSKRLYIFNNINNASAPEADPIYSTTELNERFKTANGITNVLWEMRGVSEQFYAKVQSQCVSFGEYEIDICGNLKGQLESDNKLYPRPVNKNSYHAKFTGATATEVSMVMFNYDYEYTTSDGNQWYIPFSEFGVNNPLSLKSLIDVNLAITVDSATNLTVVANFDYGYASKKTSWTGAALADFTANNLTTPAVITISSVAETATEGTYTIVIPAQTAADECTLEAFRAATGVLINGYESKVTAFTAQ